MEERTQLTQADLLGTWKLIDFKITKPDGLTKNWGENSQGILIYDKSGHMSTSINSGTEANTASRNLEANILFYAGTYELTGHNQITHYVTNASDPKRIGKSFIRNAEITNQNQLRLTAEGEYGHANLLWEKA